MKLLLLHFALVVPALVLVPTVRSTNFAKRVNEVQRKGGMNMGMRMGMGMGMNKKIDTPSVAPVIIPTRRPSSVTVPTILPPVPVRPPVPVPVLLPVLVPALEPINPDCVPTVGSCVGTVDDLIAVFNRTNNDDVVALCGGNLLTTSPFEIQADRVTFCCETLCLLENTGNDLILSVTGDSVTISNLIFWNGISDTNGGNVAIFGAGSHKIVGSTFTRGAADKRGGNLFINSTGSVLIENSQFYDGVATESGGGVYIEQATSVTISGSTFANNAANEGGGLFITKEDPSSVGQIILIDGSVFSGNSADAGGGLTVAELGVNPTLIVMNSEFTNNFANLTAGAGAIIEFLDNLELTLEGNTANGNFGGNDPDIPCDGFLTVADMDADAPKCIQGDEDFSG